MNKQYIVDTIIPSSPQEKDFGLFQELINNKTDRRLQISSNLEKARKIVDQVSFVDNEDYDKLQEIIDNANKHIEKITDKDLQKYPMLVVSMSPDIERIKNLQEYINKKCSYNYMVFKMDMH